MTNGKIRLATPDDASKLLNIYAYYVERTVVSFETDTPSVDEFRGRIRSISLDFPYLIYEENSTIIGYAYASRCFARAAYMWDAETTAYLDFRRRGRGVGSALYETLIEILGVLGYKNLYAVITSENEESLKFHEKNGFSRFCIFDKAGWKSGRWLDVSWFERKIGTFEGVPMPPLSISDVSQELISDICARHSVQNEP